MNNPVWKFFTSLRLTVVLLTLGLLLVFFGTIAQVHEGLWDAQGRWFRSILVTRSPEDPWWFPPLFPGGYTIGVMLLLNLIAAHIKRFQWSQKKIGINLTHFGIILLLVGQLVTDLFSRESHLSLKEGETKNYSEAHRANELVFATDAGNGQDKVVSVPEKVVAKKGEISDPQLPFTVRVKEYGINSEVFSKAEVDQAMTSLSTAVGTVQSQYGSAEAIVPQAERAQESAGREEVWRAALAAVGETKNDDVVAAAKRVAADPSREGKLREELKARFQAQMLQGFAERGGAMKIAAEQFEKKDGGPALPELKPASSEGAGLIYSVFPLPEAKDMDSRNLPYAIIEVVPKDGKSLGTWLVTPLLNNQEVKVGDAAYRVAFRFERYYHPFSVTLLKTTHEVYRGTVTKANRQGIPKNFQSRVRINNPQTGEAREVDIYMNNPLRYAGLTFYQYQMGRDEKREVGTSTLQVVRNPGWLTPYFGCLVVGLGMTWQFLYHLTGFMRKRNAPEPSPTKPRGGKRSSKREPAAHAA